MSDVNSTKDFATRKTPRPLKAQPPASPPADRRGTLGLLAGIGALAIPGVGPFIAAGPIMGALAGLGVVGAVGGLVGALVGMGIPQYEAKRYEGRVKDGGVLSRSTARPPTRSHGRRRSSKRTEPKTSPPPARRPSAPTASTRTATSANSSAKKQLAYNTSPNLSPILNHCVEDGNVTLPTSPGSAVAFAVAVLLTKPRVPHPEPA